MLKQISTYINNVRNKENDLKDFIMNVVANMISNNGNCI